MWASDSPMLQIAIAFEKSFKNPGNLPRIESKFSFDTGTDMPVHHLNNPLYMQRKNTLLPFPMSLMLEV